MRARGADQTPTIKCGVALVLGQLAMLTGLPPGIAIAAQAETATGRVEATTIKKMARPGGDSTHTHSSVAPNRATARWFAALD